MKAVILDTIYDLCRDFLYYDRKDDESLSYEQLEKAVMDGEITIEEMTHAFKQHLIDALPVEKIKTVAMGEALFDLIKDKCTSDMSASAAVNDIMGYLIGDCQCDPSDMTGYTSINSCNICGKHINEKNVIGKKVLIVEDVTQLENLIGNFPSVKGMTPFIVATNHLPFLNGPLPGNPIDLKELLNNPISILTPSPSPIQYGDAYCKKQNHRRKSSREI